MNDSRARFEEWADANMQYSVARSGDGYVSNTVSLAWAAWSARDAEVERLREALKKCVAKIDAEICTHEETYRGGVIWTICRGCGMKWADDRGGFKPYRDPAWLEEIRSLLSKEPK
jgi:hypothetical protein